MLNNEEIKVGKKVKQVSDGTIWTVTKRLSNKHWALEREANNGKILVSMLSTENCKFTTICNSYAFDLVTRVTIEANSEEEARKQLPLSFSDGSYSDIIYEIDEIKLVSKEEVE